MVNRPKQKGTRAESAVVTYCREHGVEAERRALEGSQDKGDLRMPDGFPIQVIEVKDQKAQTLAAWIDEMLAECENAGEDIGVVWFHRKGKGSPGDWYVLTTGDILLRICNRMGPVA